MATPSNQNVTAENLLSATVKYSNKDDANRVYDISANVRIEKGNVTNFDNGEVRTIWESSDGMSNNIATFNSYADDQLNFSIHNADANAGSAALSAVYAFMSDVKTSVSVKPVTA